VSDYLQSAGTAVITNFDPVIAGEWTTAVAELSLHEGSLIVNDGIASKGLSLLLMLRLLFKTFVTQILFIDLP